MKILLVGTAGHNLGDDALAAVLVGYLERSFPSATITVTSVNPGRLKSVGLTELPVNRKSLISWLRLLAEIRRSDLVFLGGGTLIQDALGISLLRGMIPYIWQVTFFARIMGKRVATVPIGVDELRHDKSRKMARDVLGRCDLILLRDQRSLDLAREIMGEHDSKLVISADPVFSLPEVRQGEIYNRPYIVISYVKERRDEGQVVDELVDLAKHVREVWPDHLLVLLSMDTREEDELGVYRKAAERLDPGAVIVESPSDYRRAACLIRHATAVVAMRLHAMILALGHVPVVGISRTTKTDTLIAQADMYGLAVRDFSAKKVVELLMTALFDPERVAKQRVFVDMADNRFRESMDELSSRMLAFR